MKRALLLLLALAACKQEMQTMPRLDPMEPAPMFDGGSEALRPPPGTVAASAVLDPAPQALPARVPSALVQRGRERFDIFCAPCHGPTGEGDGMIVQRGFPAPPSFHDPGLIAAPDRHFYDVISNGFGVMFPYGSRVPPADRWAIVAYVRALQLAFRTPVALLPPGERP